MSEIKIANDPHLFELKTVFELPSMKYEKSPDYKSVKWQISDLSSEMKLRLAKEYNESNDTSKVGAVIIGTMLRSDRERVFRPEEAKEVASALERCAETYVREGASDYEKYKLGRKLKNFVVGHPETASQVFATLEKHLTDVDVIEPIRSCMSRDHSLLDKGFAAIHRSADAICAQAQKEGKENPQFAASEQIRLAFADLYNFNGQLDSAETIDKITAHFPSFDKQIQRMNPEGHDFVSCNLENACHLWHEHAKSELIYQKMQVLSETFREFDRSTKPFAEIYAATSAKHKDDMERLHFMEKVHQKISAKRDMTKEDIDLLRKISKPHDFTTLKKAGDVDFNKMIMSARQESRKE